MENVSDIAAQDQTDAREREYDRKAQRVAVYFLVVMLLVVLYSVLAAMGVVPAAPWSPLGK